MGIKQMLMKKMLKSQMKGMPDAEVDKILLIVEKNPELFQKLGLEIQEKMKDGKDQMEATMEVMGFHQKELKEILGK